MGGKPSKFSEGQFYRGVCVRSQQLTLWLPLHQNAALQVVIPGMFSAFVVGFVQAYAPVVPPFPSPVKSADTNQAAAHENGLDAQDVRQYHFTTLRRAATRIADFVCSLQSRHLKEFWLSCKNLKDTVSLFDDLMLQ